MTKAIFQMQHSHLPLLTAPEGGGVLALTVLRQDDGDIIEGTLTDASGRVYPIKDGIPRRPTSTIDEAALQHLAVNVGRPI